MHQLNIYTDPLRGMITLMIKKQSNVQYDHHNLDHFINKL